MKAKKIKIYIRAKHFSIPIPALRFSTLRWLSKTVIKWVPKPDENSGQKVNYFKRINDEDIDRVIDQLEQEEAFELVDIEAVDEEAGKVIVKIYTF